MPGSGRPVNLRAAAASEEDSGGGAGATIATMRRRLLVLATVAVLAAAGAAGASARLSPVEQHWVTPLLKVYNVESASLSVVQQEERATDALVAGSGKNNTLLTETLLEFVECPSAVKAAGKPPSVRLETFDSDMVASCAHLAAGGNDVGKAIGQIRSGDVARARSDLEASLTEFVAGSKLLAAAERQLMVIGGKSVFAA